MRAGEKAYYNGTQVALFPMDYIYCTQVPDPNGFSHCCGTATDWVGPTNHYPFYAPFDCHLVAQNSSENLRAYMSNTPVVTPSGTFTMITGFVHDDNPPSQTSFSQGDLIGHTGVTGFVTGDHVHIDQTTASTYTYQASGRICGSGNMCYFVPGGIYAPEAYFLTGNETMVTTLGQTFKTWDGSITNPIKKWILGAAALKRKRGEDLGIYRKHRSIL